MKRTKTLFKAAVVFAMVCIMALMTVACTKTYKIGDKGPGGGIVFYDGGESFRAGMRYLEAAPADTEFEADWDEAKARCESLNIKGITGWRLPDKEELNLMYRNLKRNGIGGFGDDVYWSSSEDGSDGSWGQRFSDGNQYCFSKNYKVYSVRAVRVF